MMNHDTTIFVFRYPEGDIEACVSACGVRRIHLCETPSAGGCGASPPILPAAEALSKALTAYFSGLCTSFADIPLDLIEGTPFQRAVWHGARTIPWGRTLSYAALAARIGRPRSVRAAGQALGANPLPLLVPCHRVVAADGSLGGFSAGLRWKRVLLRLEGHFDPL